MLDIIMVKYQAYDVKAKKMVNINAPKPKKLSNGMWAIQGTSPLTGNTVTRIVGKVKPVI